MLAENDLSMEMARIVLVDAQCLSNHLHHWIPPHRDCLKLNVDAGYKEGSASLAVLTRNDTGKVQGLWYERAKFPSVLSIEAKAIYNACVIAKDKPYLKVLIEIDYKVVVEAILGYSSCP